MTGATQTSRSTALTDVHRALGATFTAFAGWNMPVRYGSEVAEHHAVRTAAGLFDLSHMGEIEVVGPDAGRALDHALVGRPSVIALNRARYTMICAEDGGIIDDLVVYRLREERYIVVANAANVATVSEALDDRLHRFDADITDVSERWALLAVQGPASAAILREVVTLEVDALPYYAVEETVLAGHDVLLARTGYTGEDGFEVYCDVNAAETIWNVLLAEGRPHGLRPAGLACRDTLRLEAGMPLYGHELGADITPFEAGLGRVVSFTKEGGFVGETALLARRDKGAQRTLVGLVTSGRRSPRAGYPVLDPATGRQVGHVTSGAPSPTLGHPIAIASVAIDAKEPGTRLLVDLRGSREPAEVVPLPFYRRQN